MASIPRTLFVIINDSRLVISEPNTTLYHDQWFVKSKLTDENMCRRFLDMHVRGYYKDGAVHFYRSPTNIYDDQDISVMQKKLPELLQKLKDRNEITQNQEIKLYAGYKLNTTLISTHNA